MNPRPPKEESASSSVSPSTEASAQEVTPPKEKLKRWHYAKARLRAATGSLPLDWSSEDLDNAEPALPRKPWPRWLRRLVTGVGVVAACGIAFGCWIWRHFSHEAAKYDVAHLQHLSQGTRIVDREGEFVGTMFSQDRKFIKVTEAPQTLVNALIATEDSRFFTHGGVDLKSIFRAMTVNLTRGSVRQGASTITQQLARQAFELKGRTLHRKLLETFVARRLEAAYSKSQILEFYLNQIYLGGGFYGVGAAARGYFGKEVKDLSLEEAAMIVGIIKAPVSFSPYRSPAAAQRVRNLTLDRMAALGNIDAATCAAAKAKPVAVLPENKRADRPEYLVAAVEREMDARHRNQHPEQVAITVDLQLQGRLLAVLRKHVERVEKDFAGSQPQAAGSSQALQAAVVVLNNHTGEILATIGGRDYRTSPFDRAQQGQRPAGTAFLPLSYAAIFSVSAEAGNSWVLDGPLDNRRVMVGGTEGIVGEWGGEGQKQVYEGQVSAQYALFRGKTGATVRLGYQAGLDLVKARLEQCGFDSKLREQASLLLGSSEVRLIEMARAYAAIAADGKLPPAPALITQLQHADGSEVEASVTPGAAGAFAPGAAAAVRGVLSAFMQKPEIQSVLRENGLEKQPLAGYGGTAYGFTDAWFIGSDPEITCAVWMGYDVARSIGAGAWAVKTALPFWAEAMAAAAESDRTAGGKAAWPKTGSLPALGIRSGPPAASVTSSATTQEVWKQSGINNKKGSGGNDRAAGVRSVTPTQPVVVGPDVYGALESPRAEATGKP